MISAEAEALGKALMSEVKFKNDKVAPPDIYLGAKLEPMTLNGYDCWSMGSTEYVKSAVANVEEKLAKEGKKLPSKAFTPMSSKHSYSPELDSSDYLEGEELTYFQELIGILRWAIELGRVDIFHEVSILSQFQAAPREGHMEEVLHIFAFLKRKPKLRLAFSPQNAILKDVEFNLETAEFLEQYRDAEEEIPEDAPEPRGNPMELTSYVDASHAANKVNRRSHTGYLIFAQRAPIVWYSKLQKTVESSAFGAEFIAMKTMVEHNKALRYKLRMFGIPVAGPTRVLCDNESVVKNSSRFESVLNKKHNAIAYHVTRWATAAKEIIVGWVKSQDNLADALTKRLSQGERDKLFGDWTY